MKLFRFAAAILATALTTGAVEAQSHVERVTVASARLGEDRAVLIRTPGGYARSSDRYPVLYLTDGDVQIDHTIATIEFLSRQGRMPEMIIVGITNTDRTRDLTPTHASMTNGNGQQVDFPTSGGADKFLKFIETELIPEVENRYRTAPFRVLAGHSFGGLFAMHAMLTRPGIFNAFIAVSPTMGWDNGYVGRKARDVFSKPPAGPITLFFTMANEGGASREGFRQLEKLLGDRKPRGLEWGSMLMEDEDHGSVVLRSHYHGLRKVFEGWQMALANTPPSLKEVDAHYAKLTGKFGFDILPPETMINGLGYQHLGAGKMETAIEMFKWNVAHYPKSANVYDSLGEAYEKLGNLELALPMYRKAAETGMATGDPNTPVYRKNYERVEGAKKAAGGGND